MVMELASLRELCASEQTAWNMNIKYWLHDQNTLLLLLNRCFKGNWKLGGEMQFSSAMTSCKISSDLFADFNSKLNIMLLLLHCEYIRLD